MEVAKKYRVGVGEAGQRLDNFLIKHFKGVPRSRVYRLVRKGEVRVNGSRCKPHRRLSHGDEVRLPPVRRAAPATPLVASGELLEELENRILYRDEAMLVIDKPAGLAVQGGSGIGVSLIAALRQGQSDGESLQLVHRLDRSTSGCLVLAKNYRALRQLQQIFRDRQVAKTYMALVAGRWPEGLEQVALPLVRQRSAGGQVRTHPEGREALTHFQVLAHHPGASLLQVMPLTGRTHQIRVHANAMGHPLAGDIRYGDPAFNRELEQLGLKRLFLHATELQFLRGLPARSGPFSVRAELPEDLDEVLRALVAGPPENPTRAG